jgi:ABC-type uncharacterized transport system auxiliary subunit
MKASLWSIAILCVLIPACGAARPIRYYQLEIPPPAPVSAGSGFGVSLQVGNIEAPPIMRDGRILYQVDTHEVGAYEYHRWVETPDRVVQDALVRLLRASGKFQSVDTPRNAVKSDYIVQGKIYEFSEMDKPEIHSRVSLEIELHDGKTGRTIWSRVYTDEESVNGKEVPDVVHSLDQNLGRGLSQIVAGLDQYFAASVPPAGAQPQR